MSSLFPEFFECNEYLIDEKVTFLQFENEYKVYNDLGVQIGAIKQRVSGWHKVLRLLLNKAMLPFLLELKDTNDNLLVSVERGWTFWMSKITIINSNQEIVGYIKQKFTFLKPRFTILNASEELIGEISGDWKAWNFSIKDAGGNEIGFINKKWAGAMKEFFTSADKYYVNIHPSFNEDQNKINIVATAITIDMVLKESK
ncbi:MAG: scramblase [Chitinophagaceae bacterium]|jgi:uncharacterized protein YxjI|nr:scramblase [Chitinophagaceae bacterium]